MEDDAAVKPPREPVRSKWGVPNTAAVSIPHELSFENISHRFGESVILQDISLTAATGTVTCLLGPSGSGKTTLLRIAAGMERQTSGRVLQDGREIGGPSLFMPPEKRGIGLVFQDYALFPHLTICQNVCFGLAHLKRADRIPQAMQTLARVGLDDRADEYPSTLSGGEQQRVALARAMAPRPGVLLMDEPFSGLDSRLRDSVRDETLGVLRETRATSLIVTHDPAEALKMGDRIALMNRGIMEQFGTPEDLYYRPKTLFAAGFFSELNLFEGVVRGSQVETPLGAIKADGMREGAAAVVAIRLPALYFDPAGKGATARILSRRFLGDFDQITVGVSGVDVPLKMRLRAGALESLGIDINRNLSIRVDPKGCFVFPAVETTSSALT
ncbi:ABC transporter ATP-binding protein [Pseudahrensia aquimaris]|uniref:ABC transporter ATP-binding protein n=1 Tax=Pseudahrensia aquimaris TaxID=744461 RepID=A0ABW3FK40_9HYPH